MALKAPIVVDTTRLAPVPDPKMYDVDCSNCGKARARWLFTPEDADEKGDLFMCSICWLYDSNWGKNRREDVDALIEDTEVEMARTFVRGGKGRLVNREDADRILGAICYVSKLLALKKKAGMLDG